MYFFSDNEVGIAPELIAAINRANEDSSMPYGDDSLTRKVEQQLCQTFDYQFDSYLLASGSAANCLALACLSPPGSIIYAHHQAHIITSEGGGPEFFSGGARVVALPGADGKLHASDLETELSQLRVDVHGLIPAALSLTQASEAGTVYTIDELHELCDIAHNYGLLVQMDGTRFANALASIGCQASELSWKAGVDVLCFGASKNGALAAEAVLFFNHNLAATFERRRKRSGHLLSKMRFIAAQFNAYLEQQRWLSFAQHANAMAQSLSLQLQQQAKIKLLYPCQANIVFALLPAQMLAAINQAGFAPHHWPNDDGTELVRLVTSFNTKATDVNALVEICTRAMVHN